MSDPTPAISLHVVIRGRVQGVGFRYWLRETATRHGVTGWARNLTCGGVEALLCGSDSAVKAVISDCAVGPRFSQVGQVEVIGTGHETTTGFEILRTAPPRTP